MAITYKFHVQLYWQIEGADRWISSISKYAKRERTYDLCYIYQTKKNSQSLEKNFSLLPPLPNDGQTFSGFFNGDLVQSDFEDNTQNPCKWVGFSSNGRFMNCLMVLTQFWSISQGIICSKKWHILEKMKWKLKDSTHS